MRTAENKPQPKISIEAAGKQFNLNLEAIQEFLEETEKFTSVSELPTLFEIITEFTEEGAPDNYLFSEMKRILRLLRKTNLLLMDMAVEVE